MALLNSMKTVFFKEPRKSKYDWIVVGYGIVAIGLSIAGIVESEVLVLGLAFVLMGGAELLSVDQRRLSALFRVASIGAFIAYGIALILTL